MTVGLRASRPAHALFVLPFVAVYALLLATYAGSCLIVERLNRRLAPAKIQARATTLAQIRRDQRQSVLSLAGIGLAAAASAPPPAIWVSTTMYAMNIVA